MKKKIQLTSGVTLINQKYKSNQFYHFFSETDNVLVIAKINNKFVIVRQRRVPINNYNYEFPVGRVEKNENIYKAAKREFEEETGFQISVKLKKFLTCYVDPGRNTKKIHCFYASKIKKISLPEKGISVILLTANQLYKLIKKNIFNNSFNVAALYFFLKNKIN